MTFDLNKILLVLSVCGLLGSGALAYKALNQPLNVTNHITQHQHQDQSQWQSTIIFPNKQMPFKVEMFVWEPQSWNIGGQQMIDELKAKYGCVFFFAGLVPMNRSQSLITCFQEVKKNEKL